MASMQTNKYTMTSLFDQLGLDSTESAIIDFMIVHSPLGITIPLHKASVWTKSQAAFLLQAVTEDSEWCALVDQLDTCLR